MKIPYDDILGIIRTSTDLRVAFESLRDIGKAHMPSEVWNKIKTPQVDADLWLASAWIKENIVEARPKGVYLGFDTLNELQGDGTNVEIGMTSAADPAVLEMPWVYRLERRGDHHLIDGVYRAHRSYQKFGLEYPRSAFADFLFSFGYGGLVLASAIEHAGVNWNCLFVWGSMTGTWDIFPGRQRKVSSDSRSCANRGWRRNRRSREPSGTHPRSG